MWNEKRASAWENILLLYRKPFSRVLKSVREISWVRWLGFPLPPTNHAQLGFAGHPLTKPHRVRGCHITYQDDEQQYVAVGGKLWKLCMPRKSLLFYDGTLQFPYTLVLRRYLVWPRVESGGISDGLYGWWDMAGSDGLKVCCMLLEPNVELEQQRLLEISSSKSNVGRKELEFGLPVSSHCGNVEISRWSQAEEGLFPVLYIFSSL